MVARGLYPPPDGNPPCYESNAALRSPSAGRPCRRSVHLVSNPVPTTRRHGDLRLGEYHHVESSVFYRTYGLCQPKALAVLYGQRPDGKTGWSWGAATRRQQSRVQAVVAMGDWVVKFD